jgi:hypothetical protein
LPFIVGIEHRRRYAAFAILRTRSKTNGNLITAIIDNFFAGVSVSRSGTGRIPAEF